MRAASLARRETVILHELDQNENSADALAEIREQLRRAAHDHGREAAAALARRIGVFDRFPNVMEGL
jgi:hypothetical protein